MSTVAPGLTPGLDLNLAADGLPGGTPAWKLELNQKLAAARARRAGKGDLSTQVLSSQKQSGLGTANQGGARASSVAAAVAARYAKEPSYREMLARETEAALQAAEQAAQQALAATQAIRARLEAAQLAEAAAQREAEQQSAALKAEPEPLVVRLELDERTQRRMDAMESRQSTRAQTAPAPAVFIPSVPVLRDPIEEVLIAPVTPLPANLIEFPRELIALRKARPRLAEGPLREVQDAPEGDRSQLRIFEVGDEVASSKSFSGDDGLAREASAFDNGDEGTTWEPEPEAPAYQPPTYPHSAHTPPASPEWSSIRLDAQVTERERRNVHQSALEMPLKTASVEDRTMAALVDGALVVAAFMLFVLVFCACTAHPPTGKGAIAGAALVFVALAVVYQWLFFTFSESTPGMRYARIALCTFGDDNPTRKAMRRRIGALLLSVCPLGLGLLWAFFDEDRLGWHDRISGMYQRSYR